MMGQHAMNSTPLTNNSNGIQLDNRPKEMLSFDISRAGQRHAALLKDFFLELVKSREDNKYFHPHSFTPEYAQKIADYNGRDLYYVVEFQNKIIGYGMLRGWDEGYEIPSLGITIHPEYRGYGLGRHLMYYLHNQAIENQVKQIRLKVHSDNYKALELYRSLGYKFGGIEANQLVGIVNL